MPATEAPGRRQREGRGAGHHRRRQARARDDEAGQAVRRAGAQALQQDRRRHRRIGEDSDGATGAKRRGTYARAINTGLSAGLRKDERLTLKNTGPGNVKSGDENKRERKRSLNFSHFHFDIS